MILDNLIAAGKAKPMIIVMDNLNAVKPGESAASSARAAWCRRQVPLRHRQPRLRPLDRVVVRRPPLDEEAAGLAGPPIAR